MIPWFGGNYPSGREPPGCRRGHRNMAPSTAVLTGWGVRERHQMYLHLTLGGMTLSYLGVVGGGSGGEGDGRWIPR